MRIEPDFEAFERRWRAGEGQLVRWALSSDLETPVSLSLKLAQGRAPSFLLESVTGGENQARYSIIGVGADLVWRCRGEIAEVSRDGGATFSPESETPLASLRGLLGASRMALPAGLPPMAAGVFGYLGYDMVRLVERLGPPNLDPLELPDAILLRPQLVAVIDGVKSEATLGAPCWRSEETDPRTAYDRAVALLKDAARRLDGPTPAARGQPPETRPVVEPKSNTTREAYCRIVQRAREYIRAGDIFQVVPSQRWSLPFPRPAMSLYRALRRTNPSPYMFYFDFGECQVVGASPEILVQVRNGRVTIRPIAGTRRRGATPEEDKRLEAELLADSKELAEHLMLLDLGRNDVGRVAKIGTVRPTEQFTVERYSHVMHIVSNVEGEIRDNQDALDALLAGLPAGTVSGAPKIRAMEIIDELEQVKRGVYAGVIAYFSADGDTDNCIALRTAVVKDGVMHVQAGGGVVLDSDPDAEYEETVAKADALLRAARESVDFD